MTFPKTLEPFFCQYDATPFALLAERTVYSNLTHYIKSNALEIVPECLAEIMAFEFLENYTGKPSVWNIYYQPQIYYQEGDNIVQSPDITLITKEFIDYWEYRSKEVVHPILKARYSGLVIEFSQGILQQRATREISLTCAENLLESVVQNLNGSETIDRFRLERALGIALKYNEKEIIARIKALILQRDSAIPVNEVKNVWASSFDLLVDRKPMLTSTHEEKIVIDLLESRIRALKDIDPWATKAAAERLAGYYYKKSSKADVKRVLTILGESFQLYTANVPPIQVAGHLQELMLVYRLFQLNEEAEKLLIQIRSMSKSADEEFKKIAFSHDFETSELVKYANQILKYEDIDITFARIIKAQILTKEEVVKGAKEAFERHPIRFIVPTNIVDRKGRVLAKITPYSESRDGHEVQYLYQSLQLAGVYLHFIFLEGKRQGRITEDTIMTFLKRSCIIEPERIGIIQAGMNAFFDGNYLACIHLLIPQFEEAIRNLLEVNGGNVLTYSDHTYPVKTFHTILEDPIVVKAFGEDHVYYFKALFTDSRGWNLRNQVAHGLLEPELFNEQTAQRLMHAFFCLGMIRWQDVPVD